MGHHESAEKLAAEFEEASQIEQADKADGTMGPGNALTKAERDASLFAEIEMDDEEKSLTTNRVENQEVLDREQSKDNEVKEDEEDRTNKSVLIGEHFAPAPGSVQELLDNAEADDRRTEALKEEMAAEKDLKEGDF